MQPMMQPNMQPMMQPNMQPMMQPNMQPMQQLYPGQALFSYFGSQNKLQNGQLPLNHFAEFVKEIGLSPAQTNMLWWKQDKDHNGFLSMEEFVKMSSLPEWSEKIATLERKYCYTMPNQAQSQPQTPQHRKGEKLFYYLLNKGDCPGGFLEFGTFVKLCEHINLSVGQVQKIWWKQDVDKNGKLSLDEFVSLCSKPEGTPVLQLETMLCPSSPSPMQQFSPYMMQQPQMQQMQMQQPQMQQPQMQQMQMQQPQMQQMQMQQPQMQQMPAQNLQQQFNASYPNFPQNLRVASEMIQPQPLFMNTLPRAQTFQNQAFPVVSPGSPGVSPGIPQQQGFPVLQQIPSQIFQNPNQPLVIQGQPMQQMQGQPMQQMQGQPMQQMQGQPMQQMQGQPMQQMQGQPIYQVQPQQKYY